MFELIEKIQCSRLDDQRCMMPVSFNQVGHQYDSVVVPQNNLSGSSRVDMGAIIARSMNMFAIYSVFAGNFMALLYLKDEILLIQCSVEYKIFWRSKYNDFDFTFSCSGLGLELIHPLLIIPQAVFPPFPESPQSSAFCLEIYLELFSPLFLSPFCQYSVIFAFLAPIYSIYMYLLYFCSCYYPCNSSQHSLLCSLH